MHHAHAVNVNVTDGEYDSEDSSDGETIEDVTIGIAQTRLSGETDTASSSNRNSGTGTIEGDEEFKARWGNAWIDRNAVPKKGILKRESTLRRCVCWVFCCNRESVLTIRNRVLLGRN